jgi:hydroxyacylglutathione hydrolase
MEVIGFDTPDLGDRSYLVSDGLTGLVIDPQRDIDRILETVDDQGIEITHVLETHIHNDYVNGAWNWRRLQAPLTSCPPSTTWTSRD